MAWARLDDGWHDHPKVIAAGMEAAGLWVMCLTWAHKNRKTSPRPGYVPLVVLQRFAGTKATRLAKRLTDAGLFDATDGTGFDIHDFTDYLPKYDATKAAEAGKAGASKRWGHPDATPPDDEPPPENDGEPIANRYPKNGSRASARRNPVPTTRTPPSGDPPTDVALVDAHEHAHSPAGAITALYAAGVPLADHARAHRTIAEALQHYDPDKVRRGIGRLIAEQRTCTPDALRIAIHGDDQPATPTGRRRTATEKAHGWLTVGTDNDTPDLRALPGGAS